MENYRDTTRYSERGRIEEEMIVDPCGGTLFPKKEKVFERLYARRERRRISPGGWRGRKEAWIQSEPWIIQSTVQALSQGGLPGMNDIFGRE